MVNQNDIDSLKEKVDRWLEKGLLYKIEKKLHNYETFLEHNRQALLQENNMFTLQVQELQKLKARMDAGEQVRKKDDVGYVQIVNMLRTVLGIEDEAEPLILDKEKIKKVLDEIKLTIPDMKKQSKQFKEKKIENEEKKREEVYTAYNDETGKNPLYGKKFTSAFKKWLEDNKIELTDL